MASSLPTASGDISLGKIESPVVEKNSATGLHSNDKSTLEEYLRTENSRLEEDNASLRQSINEFVDQKIQWYDSLKENPVLKAQVIQLTEEIEQLRSHSRQLKQENSELHKPVGNSVAPDYEATRDRTLAKLKMGKQSAVGKAIDAFIKELRHLKTASTAASVADKTRITSKTDDQTVTTIGEQNPPTWEARADDFLKEVAGNG